MTETTAPTSLASIEAPIRDLLVHRAAAVAPDPDDIHGWMHRFTAAPGFALMVELNSQLSFLECHEAQKGVFPTARAEKVYHLALVYAVMLRQAFPNLQPVPLTHDRMHPREAIVRLQDWCKDASETRVHGVPTCRQSEAFGALMRQLLALGAKPINDATQKHQSEPGHRWLPARCYRRRTNEADPGEGQSADEKRSPALPPALKEVWDLLENHALTGQELAQRVKRRLATEGAMRKRLSAIRLTGRTIDNKRGFGFYRPDAPPDDLRVGERESC